MGCPKRRLEAAGNPQDRSNTAPLTKDDRMFLVNLADDIGERKNLAQQHPEIVRDLVALRKDYLQSITPDTTSSK